MAIICFDSSLSLSYQCILHVLQVIKLGIYISCISLCSPETSRPDHKQHSFSSSWYYIYIYNLEFENQQHFATSRNEYNCTCYSQLWKNALENPSRKYLECHSTYPDTTLPGSDRNPNIPWKKKTPRVHPLQIHDPSLEFVGAKHRVIYKIWHFISCIRRVGRTQTPMIDCAAPMACNRDRIFHACSTCMYTLSLAGIEPELLVFLRSTRCTFDGRKVNTWTDSVTMLGWIYGFFFIF